MSVEDSRIDIRTLIGNELKKLINGRQYFNLFMTFVENEDVSVSYHIYICIHNINYKCTYFDIISNIV